MSTWSKLFVVLLVVGSGGIAWGGWTDDFSGSSLDPRWGLDIPNAVMASITLDDPNDRVNLHTTAWADMWAARADAPILWAATPSGDFYVETHVDLGAGTKPNVIGGLTVYGNGVSDDGKRPAFTMSLDHWTLASKTAKIQTLGGGPAYDAGAIAGLDDVWLRLLVRNRNTVHEAWNGYYKLNAGDAWTPLPAGLFTNVDDARLGVVMKNHNSALPYDSYFDYVAMQEINLSGTVQTWDFESGDLTGWNVVTTGVPGDNLVFTTAGNQPTAPPYVGFDGSTVQGSYFVRTWEGEVLGNSDAHTGILETPAFQLGSNAWFDLLVGGGFHPFYGDPDNPQGNITAVNLERLVGPNDWEVLFSSTGRNANNMMAVSWDARTFAGETVRLRIYDTSTVGWGHIDVDNIVLSTFVPEPSTLALLLGLGGMGLLGSIWRRRRQAG